MNGSLLDVVPRPSFHSFLVQQFLNALQPDSVPFCQNMFRYASLEGRNQCCDAPLAQAVADKDIPWPTVGCGRIICLKFCGVRVVTEIAGELFVQFKSDHPDQ
jgi:hypothetical protein